jgi:phosphoribosylpyrophosphate synthetase
MNPLEIEPNDHLQYRIKAYYHGYHKGWFNTEVGYINTLKNDDGTFSNNKKEFGYTLTSAQESLYKALKQDLPIIAKSTTNKLAICVMPRSKRDQNYKSTQLLFIDTIKRFVKDNADLFNDGTDYIQRIIDTPTTHITKDYDSVKKGITKMTCKISENVKEKDILLIDDIYTENVNIDEDAIQALLDKGAKNVFFYAVGKTYKGQPYK